MSKQHSNCRIKSRQKTNTLVSKVKVSSSKPHIFVYHLLLDPNLYRFKQPFPNFIRQQKDKTTQLLEKLWFIKKTIRYKTQFNNPIEPIDEKSYIHPEGFCSFPPLFTSRSFNNVYNELEDLYSYILHYQPDNVLVSNQQKTRGLIYLFTGDKGKTQYYNESMTYLINQGYSSLVRLIQKYIQFLCHIYQVPYTSEFLQEHVQLVLLRYDLETGIWLHIDNIARYDQGPIVTVSIGQPYVYYDMTPAILPNKLAVPLRFVSTEGSILIMDGSSRMEWSHGLPYGVSSPDGKRKYTIMFKCDKFRTIHPIYNKVLDHTVTSSGEVC